MNVESFVSHYSKVGVDLRNKRGQKSLWVDTETKVRVDGKKQKVKFPDLDTVPDDADGIAVKCILVKCNMNACFGQVWIIGTAKGFKIFSTYLL